MKSDLIRVFQTLEHPCGYFEDRKARNLVIDPVARGLPQIYALAIERGFRRSGGHVYRPHCRGCTACLAVRIPVARFRRSRSQRRCAQRNADLVSDVVTPSRSAEHFELYQRYVNTRHAGAGMDDPEQDDFERFLTCRWSPTRFLELRQDGALRAVAVLDTLPSGLSAVYTFYDPDSAGRGLGTYSILLQIELARAENLPYLYLGYWIHGHPKMDYKARFRPLEVLQGGHWQTLE